MTTSHGLWKRGIFTRQRGLTNHVLLVDWCFFFFFNLQPEQQNTDTQTWYHRKTERASYQIPLIRWFLNLALNQFLVLSTLVPGPDELVAHPHVLPSLPPPVRVCMCACMCGMNCIPQPDQMTGRTQWPRSARTCLGLLGLRSSYGCVCMLWNEGESGTRFSRVYIHTFHFLYPPPPPPPACNTSTLLLPASIGNNVTIRESVAAGRRGDQRVQNVSREPHKGRFICTYGAV